MDSNFEKVSGYLISRICKSKYNIDIDYSKSLPDNGLDELDIIELLLDIEIELDIVIPDDDTIYDIFDGIRIQINRDKKLTDLGI
jgi:acyl carrier protein